MKREMEIVREILLHIDEAEEAVVDKIELEQYSSEQVAYHINLLVDAGLLTGTDHYLAHGWGFPIWVGLRLTWNGHEFIDAARNDKVWNTFKKTVAEKGGSITFSVALSLLNAYLKQEFGL
jgi:hypothetical protein